MSLSSTLVAAGLLVFGVYPEWALGEGLGHACSDDTDCLPKERCLIAAGNSFCLPSSTPSPIYGPCKTGAECKGDTCCENRVCSVWDAKSRSRGDFAMAHCECEAGLRLLDYECACPPGDQVCGEPHMGGLRGQRIDWSGVDGGWYSLIKDDDAGLSINARLTAPLPDEFPDRQLVTGLTVMSEGHSLTIEVESPHTIDTDGCPEGVSPCLANGGLRMVVDGKEDNELLRFSRQVAVAGGAISVSASNLPVECRPFGGDKIWARMYQEMLESGRQLAADQRFEDWILNVDHMAAPRWCAKYIAENDLADLQSTHAIFKIGTPTVVVRLDAGVNYQGGGELDWDGRALPDLEFWQMDVGLDRLDVQNPALSGILGETTRPVYDESGKEVMEGFDAFRGTVEDYRLSSALGTRFALLDKREEGHENKHSTDKV